MRLRPLGDRVIVKAATKEEMSKGGILLPDTASKERPEQGEIIAVGPGKLDDKGVRVAMSVQVGDKVVFKKYSPDEIKMDGEEYLVVSESDLMAIVEA
ncbi:MAG: co-chaperone GroES [Patescibacteria group bacterium]